MAPPLQARQPLHSRPPWACFRPPFGLQLSRPLRVPFRQPLVHFRPLQQAHSPPLSRVPSRFCLAGMLPRSCSRPATMMRRVPRRTARRRQQGARDQQMGEEERSDWTRSPAPMPRGERRSLGDDRADRWNVMHSQARDSESRSALSCFQDRHHPTAAVRYKLDTSAYTPFLSQTLCLLEEARRADLPRPLAVPRPSRFLDLQTGMQTGLQTGIGLLVCDPAWCPIAAASTTMTTPEAKFAEGMALMKNGEKAYELPHYIIVPLLTPL